MICKGFCPGGTLKARLSGCPQQISHGTWQQAQIKAMGSSMMMRMAREPIVFGTKSGGSQHATATACGACGCRGAPRIALKSRGFCKSMRKIRRVGKLTPGQFRLRTGLIWLASVTPLPIAPHWNTGNIRVCLACRAPSVNIVTAENGYDGPQDYTMHIYPMLVE